VTGIVAKNGQQQGQQQSSECAKLFPGSLRGIQWSSYRSAGSFGKLHHNDFFLTSTSGKAIWENIVSLALEGLKCRSGTQGVK
jgi:hypothetical protein